MSYEVYKVIHLFGLMIVFSGLGAYLALNISQTPIQGAVKKFVFISHGLGLLLMIVAGFGMAARQGYMGNWPQWLTAKIIIWLAIGGIVALLKRQPKMAWTHYMIILALGLIAASLAITKPF